MSDSPASPDLTGLTSSAVSDALGTIWSPQATSTSACTDLTCVVPGKVVSGPAYTIRLSPSRTPDPEARNNLFRAYQGAPAGSVIVVQVAGEVGGAVMGDVVAHMLQLNGIAGLVIDGQVRDVATLRTMEFPVWAREVTMRAIRTKLTTSEVNVEVNCGGVQVRPNDYVVADDDGVFVVPGDESGPILALAHEIMQEEADSHAKLAAGISILDAYAPVPAPTPAS